MGKKKGTSRIELPVKRIAPVLADPSTYASFSDETKTDDRLSLGFRASINAQVLPLTQLDWFFTLLPHVSPEGAEVKSEMVVERLRFFPAPTRRRVWDGLADVRIHIFDAKPFALEVGDIFRRITGSRFPHRVLFTLEKSGDERQRVAAGRMLAIERSFVLDRVTESFPAERLLPSLEAGMSGPLDDNSAPGLGGPSRRGTGTRPPRYLIGDDERSVRTRDVDRALEEGAKSTAVLFDAQRRFREIAEEVDGWGLSSLPRHSRLRIAREVTKTHAFDEGNVKTLEAVEAQRRQVLDVALGQSMNMLLTEQKGTVEMDSTTSIFIQAADIAAGIARHVYQREGLRGVIRRFRHVSFNGELVDENNMRQVTGRMGVYLVL